MRLDVVGIDELPHLPVLARGGGLEFFDLFDNQVYIALSARGEYEIGAIRANGFLTLIAHPLRHDNDDGVAFRRANAGCGDTRVAGGTFDDGHARMQVTAPLGL